MTGIRDQLGARLSVVALPAAVIGTGSEHECVVGRRYSVGPGVDLVFAGTSELSHAREQALVFAVSMTVLHETTDQLGR